MVRVLLVVVALAAPVLSAAQAVGQVLFANDRTNPNTVNAFECDPANNAQVLVSWNPAFINDNTSVPAGGTYIVYASNTAPTNNGTQCQTTNNTPVGGTQILAGTILNTNASAPSATLSTSALLALSGLSCANDGQVLYLCVQGVQGGANMVASNFAIAQATVTISTSYPQVPAITGVTAGDGALDVSWEAGTVGTGTAITQQVELEVTPVATTTGAFDNGGTRIAGKFGASPARVDGLVNGVVYDLRARALSDAANVSDFSPAGVGTGMPQAATAPPPPKEPPPTEQPPPAGSGGGCSSGLAGPFGFAILAGALALSRTRRRR